MESTALQFFSARGLANGWEQRPCGLGNFSLGHFHILPNGGIVAMPLLCPRYAPEGPND